MTGAQRRARRAPLRPEWHRLVGYRPMRWWLAFGAAVKSQRIRHRDTRALRALVPIIDARFGRPTTARHKEI